MEDGEVRIELVKMPGVKVFLDDVRPMPDGFDVAARSFDEAARLLATGNVVEISFDHDLGDGPTGYDVACIIERAAHDGVLERIKWAVHSANPVGRDAITAAMTRADQYWTESWEAKSREAHVVHEKLKAMVKDLPSDFQPYGERNRDEPEWSPDCSCGCKHFQTLEGIVGMDWGVCSNPESPRAGLLTFEHQGCPKFEDDGEDFKNLASIVKMAEEVKSRKS